LPVEVVVPDLCCVVENLLLAGLTVRVVNQLLQGLSVQVMLLDQGVQLVDVALVMLAVVELNGPRRDDRCESSLAEG
jgi:hypothetical protein